MTSSNIKLKRVRPLLGTFVEITLAGTVQTETLNDWITLGFEAIEEIDRLMSLHRPDSDLSRLNQSQPGDWVNVNPHTLKVLKAANKLYWDSEGSFDIRCTRVTSKQAPLKIRGTRIGKTGPWTFDLGGIAKGYAVDCGMQKIKRASLGRLTFGIINAGGDLRRWGTKMIPVAVATSSVRTPDMSEGLSPAVFVQMPTGKIFKNQKSVSVVSRTCLWSDALTKVMLLAPERIAERCLRRYSAHGMVLA